MKGVAHRRPAKEGIVVNHPPEERGWRRGIVREEGKLKM
jgi:hypothetical protein